MRKQPPQTPKHGSQTPTFGLTPENGPRTPAPETGSTLTPQFNALSRHASQAIKQADNIEGDTPTLEDRAPKVLESIQLLRERMDTLKKENAELQKKIKRKTKQLQKTKQILKDTQAEKEGIATNLKNTNEALQTIQALINTQSEETLSKTKKLQKTNQTLKDTQAEKEVIATNLKNTNEALQTIQALINTQSEETLSKTRKTIKQARRNGWLLVAGSSLGIATICLLSTFPIIDAGSFSVFINQSPTAFSLAVIGIAICLAIATSGLEKTVKKAPQTNPFSVLKSEIATAVDQIKTNSSPSKLVSTSS